MYDFDRGFIAVPICGLPSVGMRARVIRIDQIGGVPDAVRWPVGQQGSRAI